MRRNTDLIGSSARAGEIKRQPTGLPGVALWLFCAACSLASAQSTVYETQGPAGPVFSDKPASGAARIELAPPNVIEGLKPPAPAPAAPPPPPPYRTLKILSLPDDGTVHSNTGAFDLMVQVSPALRTGAGDRIRVVLDGSVLDTAYSKTPMHIIAEDWGSVANPENDVHSVSVLVVDKSGATLIESTPVRFYVRRATRHRGR